MKSVVPLLLSLTLAACATPPSTTARDDTKISATMANPASVACVNQGGRVDLRTDAAGNVSGICVLPDGKQCEEWALFRDHQCVPPKDMKP